MKQAKLSLVQFSSLFFLSFFPLWICLIARCCWSLRQNKQSLFAEESTIVVILILSLIALCYSGIRRLKPRLPNASVTLLKIERSKNIQLEFLVANLLPFVAFDVTKGLEALLFSFLFICLGFICYRHYGLLWSPWLDVWGYVFYRCEVKFQGDVESTVRVITKDAIEGKKTKTIVLTRIDEYGLHFWDGELSHDEPCSLPEN